MMIWEYSLNQPNSKLQKEPQPFKAEWQLYVLPDLPISNTSFCIYGSCMVLSVNSVNQLVFVMVKCCVHFEVRTEFLNNIQTNCGFKGIDSPQYKLICLFAFLDQYNNSRLWSSGL
jgi:hypothetical protein